MAVRIVWCELGSTIGDSCKLAAVAGSDQTLVVMSVSIAAGSGVSFSGALFEVASMVGKGVGEVS
jgi:hypothetical protein